eukprot:2139278-Rhodomonas_salina.1
MHLFSPHRALLTEKGRKQTQRRERKSEKRIKKEKRKEKEEKKRKKGGGGEKRTGRTESFWSIAFTTRELRSRALCQYQIWHSSIAYATTGHRVARAMTVPDIWHSSIPDMAVAGAQENKNDSVADNGDNVADLALCMALIAA